VYRAGKDLGLDVRLGGTFVIIEGPTFSTKAESLVWRSQGFSIIGMTNLPESKLAREAEICYTTIGLVTDYDVWREGEEVSTEKVLEVIHDNVANVKKMLKAAIPALARTRDCECASAARFAVMTHPSKFPKKTFKDLELIIGKYHKKK
jgi:5'-methylthioadenosine phosphorylase